MGRLLKLEIHRAFTGPGMRVSLGAGLLISIMHIFHIILPKASIWSESVLYFKSAMQYPLSLYQEWICGNTYNPEGFLYFLLLPLLAVLPHSISFFQDRESGYIRQVYMRTERIRYLAAKSAAAFLAGGFAVTAPLLLNFMICAMFLPALPLQGLCGTFINTSVLWYQIFSAYPAVYVLIFLAVDFIFAGLVACLPFFFSFYSEKKYIILLMPFVMHLFIYAVCMMSGLPDAVHYSPAYIIFAGIGCPSALALISYIVVYGILGGALFWKIGKKEDIF